MCCVIIASTSMDCNLTVTYPGLTCSSDGGFLLSIEQSKVLIRCVKAERPP